MSDTATTNVEQPMTAGPFTRGKFAMWLFLGTEIMFFTGLIGTYIVLRLGSTSWPVPGKTLAIGLTAFNTFLLICSSVTMVQALAAIQRGDQRMLRVFLAATTLMGAGFLSVQVFEYHHLMTEGLVYAPEASGPGQGPRRLRSDPNFEANVFSEGRVVHVFQRHGPRYSDEALTDHCRELAAENSLVRNADLAKFSNKRNQLVAIGRRGVVTRVPAGDLIEIYRLGEIADAYPSKEVDPSRANYTDPGKELAEAGNYPDPGVLIKYYDHGKLAHYRKTARVFVKPLTLKVNDAERTFPEGGYQIVSHKYRFDEPENGELMDVGFLPSSGIFGSTFYTMTGFHGAHVFGGVVLMLCMTILACLGKFSRTNHSPVELAGLYWHFVDLVWILLFTIVYLF